MLKVHMLRSSFFCWSENDTMCGRHSGRVKWSIDVPEITCRGCLGSLLNESKGDLEETQKEVERAAALVEEVTQRMEETA